jgi:hypothetical protein
LSDWKLERAGRIKQEQLEKEQLTDNSNACTTDMTNSIATTTTTTTSGDGSDGSNSGTGKIQHAALIIIGDEILNGFTTDVNLQVTTKALASIGENEE